MSIDSRIEVRMRNDNFRDTTHVLNELDCVLIKICNQVPQDISLRSLDQSCTLADAKLVACQLHFPSSTLRIPPTLGSVHISHTLLSASTLSITFLYFLDMPSSAVAAFIFPSVVHA